MKKYFILYKPFLLFLAKFFLAYVVLTIVYRMYVSSIDDGIDEITGNVAYLTEQTANFFTIKISTVKQHLYYSVIYQNKIVARIIEGCNAISVIILFISFIIGFSGEMKRTLLFIFGGSLIIYILNIFRIVFLTLLMFHFPNQVHFLHGVIFPLIIYGCVFILWVVWVNKFSKYASKTDT